MFWVFPGSANRRNIFGRGGVRTRTPLAENRILSLTKRLCNATEDYGENENYRESVTDSSRSKTVCSPMDM